MTHSDENTIIADRTIKLFVTVLPDATLSVTVAQAIVSYNTKTQIQIESSNPQVNYQLLADGTPMGDPVAGNDNTINLPTDPLTADSAFQIKASKKDKPAVSINLDQQVTIQVRPNPALTVRASENIVPAGTTTAVEVDDSQSGVQYQLMVNETDIGNAVSGTGATITLPTGEITEDTLFSIRASKTTDTAIFVDLEEQALVQIEVPDESEPEEAEPDEGETSNE